MMSKDKYRKLLSFISGISLLLNSFIAPVSVLAQDATGESPEQTTTSTISEIIPTPPEVIPVVETTIPETVTVTPMVTEELSGTDIVSPIPTVDEDTTSITVLKDLPLGTNNEITKAEPSEPSASAVAKETVEKVCLIGDEIKDTNNEDWIINEDGKSVITKEKIRLGVRYVFPKENKVSITFKCLPKDESLRTTLKIQQVKTSDLKLPANIGNVGEYAYDITTGMNDGDFEYDVTLPKSTDSKAEISYIEKSVDEAKNNEVKVDDIKPIEENKTEQQTDSVKAVSIDHFSIYIVTSTGNAPVLSTAAVNGQQSVTVGPYSSITVSLSVLRDGSTKWRSTRYQIGSSGWNCVDHSNHDGNGTNSEEFIIQAPSTVGTYNLMLRASSDDNCGGTVSSDYTMPNAITVQAATITTNPTLPPTCGLDIALVLDNSTSIDNSEMTSMKNAMTAFTNALDGTPTQFSVIHFATTATVDQSFTSNISTINSKINAIPVGGGYTNWDDGLRKAQSTLFNRSNPNLIIFASDGNPNTVGNGPANNASSGTEAVDAARFVANVLKSSAETTRILALGIGTDLNQNNMKQISGPSVGTSLTNDVVVVSSFTDLANQLKAFATESCGGSITVNKYYDQVDEAHRGGAGWIYNVAGTSKTTLANGQTESVKVNSGTYTVTEENMLSGYSYGSALCYKSGSSSPIGEITTKGIKNIPVGDLDIVYCNFVNYINKTDVSITKTDSPDPVNNGGTLTYTLTVNNLTTVPATNVIVTDTLPSGFTITSVTPSAGTCSDIVGPDIKCELGTLAGSASATVTIVGTVSTVSTTITNSATVSTDTPETSTSNNSDSEDTTVNQKGHIIVQKTTVPAGDPTFFTTYLTNTNGAHLTNGSVSDSTDYTFNVDAGTYKIVEDVPSGWGVTSNPCLNGIAVGAGETKYCEIVNKKLPVLTIEKVLVGDNSPYTNFSFKVDGVNPTSFESDGNNNIYVVPGQNYTITEVDPGSNYSVSYSSGCSGNLTYYETATCRITNTKLGSISGTKFNDLNGNAVKDFGEPGILGWHINLWQNNSGYADISTDANGNYSFINLPLGTYLVCESSLSGWQQTYPGNTSCQSGKGYEVVISAGDQIINKDFGNFQLGSISGQKFNDLDNDGAKDAGESGLSGWTIWLDKNNNNVLDAGDLSTTTDSNGNYTFSNLTVGTYYGNSYGVKEVQQTNWTQTYPAGGTQYVTVISGTNATGIDFGNHRDTGTIELKKSWSGTGGQTTLKIGTTPEGSEIDSQQTGVSGTDPLTTGQNTVVTGTYYLSEETAGLTNYDSSLACTENGIPTTPGENNSISVTSNHEIICTFTNAQKLGSLTVTKTVNWNGVTANGSQTFSICIKGPSYPTTADCQTITGSTGGNLTWNNLIPGDYTVTEPTVGSEWNVVIDHSPASVPFDGGNATAQVTNTRKHGNLTITKVVNWSGITENTQKTFEICIEGPSFSSPNCNTTDSNGGDLTWSDLIPGDYNITETDPGSEWNTVITTSPVAVPVDGSTGTATVTNTLLTGTITVVKNILPSDDSGKFNLLINGTVYKTDAGNGDSTGEITLPTGQYEISETAGFETDLSLYDQQFSGDCQMIEGWSGYQLILSTGGNKTCTITNTKKARIITKKVTIPSGSDQNFHFVSNWNTDPGFYLKDGESNDSGWKYSNSYWNVREDPVPTGWDSEVSCDNGSPNDSIYLTPGQTVTCTFTNTQLGSISGKKLGDADGDTTTTGDRTVLSGWVIELWKWVSDTFVNTGLTDTTDVNGAFSFENLPPGFYQLREVLKSGWTKLFPSTGGIDVTLDAGETDDENNFVNYENVSITVCKQEDRDGNIVTSDDRSNVQGWSMTLYDDGNIVGTAQVTGANGCYTWTNLGPGNYSVSEEMKSGWTNINTVTSNATSHGFGQLQSGSGEHSWTFVNTRLGKVIVKKAMVGGTDSFDFTGDVYGTISVNNGTLELDNVVPGSDPTSEESIKTGWNLTDISCEGGRAMGPGFIDLANRNVIFRVESGETVTCTFTNTKLPTLTVTKDLYPVGHGAFDLMIDGKVYATNVGDGGTTGPQIMSIGNHQVSEQAGNPSTNMSDYNVSFGGDCSETGVISLDAGENKTCTITNIAYGTIGITKVASPQSPQDFGFTTSGKGLSTFSLDDDTDGTLSNVQYFYHLTPGQYGITETEVNGWKLTGLTCSENEIQNSTVNLTSATSNIVLDPGESVYCTFTNTRITKPLYVSKFEDLNENEVRDSGENYLNDWTFEIYDNNACSGTPIRTAITNSSAFPGTAIFDDLYLGETYWIYEVEQPGWLITTGNCRSFTIHDDNHSNNQVDFGNLPNGKIHGYKWNDVDDSGGPVSGFNEELLPGWTINLYRSNGDGGFESDPYKTMVTDDGSHFGWYWFENLRPGQYKICEVQQSGWRQTYPLNQNGNCHVVNLPTNTLCEYLSVNAIATCDEYNFGNIEEKPNLVLSKLNNSGTSSSAGSTVSYTVTVTNIGNVPVYNVTVYDVLPGGFTYLTGTTKINGISASDPSISGGKLSWNVGTLGTVDGTKEVVVEYQAKLDSELKEGVYTNVAVCTGNTRSEIYTECNTDTSNVGIGQSVDISASIKGQVLGMTLPATGSDTWMLYLLLTTLFAGITLRVVSYTLKKKN